MLLIQEDKMPETTAEITPPLLFYEDQRRDLKEPYILIGSEEIR